MRSLADAHAADVQRLQSQLEELTGLLSLRADLWLTHGSEQTQSESAGTHVPALAGLLGGKRRPEASQVHTKDDAFHVNVNASKVPAGSASEALALRVHELEETNARLAATLSEAVLQRPPPVLAFGEDAAGAWTLFSARTATVVWAWLVV